MLLPLSLLCLLFFPGIGKSQEHSLILKNITVKGNVYFSQDDIIFGNAEYGLPGLNVWEGNSYPVIVEGEALFFEGAVLERKRLLQSGYFKEIKIEVKRVGEDGFGMVFIVKENPRFTRLKLQGIEFVPKEKIAQLFDLKPGVPVNKKKIRQAESKIADLYRKEGKKAGIESVQIKDTGEVVVQIGIARISSIRIEGNALIPDSEILFLLLSKEGTLWEEETVLQDRRRLLDTGWFSQVEISFRFGKEKKFDGTMVVQVKEKWDKLLTGVEIKGLKHLKDTLFLPLIDLEIGKIISPEKVKQAEEAIMATGLIRDIKVEFIPYLDGTKLLFVLRENPYIASIRLEGNSLFSDSKLKEQMWSKEGKVLNRILLQNDIRRIEKYYFDHGFIVSSIYDNALDLQDSGKEELTLFIGEGKVESIVIEGEKDQEVISEKGERVRKSVPAELKTKDYVILREMETKPGDILNVNVLQRDLQKVFNLGFFEDIRWEPQPGTKEDSVVVVLKVREKQTMGSAMFGGGFSSQFGFSGTASIRRENLFGRGRLISLDLSFGGLTSYQARYFEPWLDKHHTSLDVQGFNTIVPKDLLDPRTNSISSFDETRKGFSFLIGRPLSRNTSLSIGYEFKSVESKLVAGSTIAGVLTKGKVGALRARLTTDSRDNRFNPSRGVFNELEGKFSGSFLGADIPFTRFNLDLRRYKKVTDNTIFAGRLLAGFYRGNRTLLEETFYVGGSETIRGYSQNIFWGTKMFVGNLEWRFPISSAQGVTGVLFVDTGFAWPEGSPVSLSDLKTGIGAGLRYTLPIGPIRIDVGYGLDVRDTQFYLSFGNLF